MNKLIRKFVLAAIAIMLAAGIMNVQAAPTGDVHRSTLLDRDASVHLTASLVAGDVYVLDFWFLNDTEANESVFVEWGHWPEIQGVIRYDLEDEGSPSAPGQWVRHTIHFVAVAGASNIQIAPNWNTRGPATVFYIGDVTITSAGGAVQSFTPADLRGNWSDSVIMTATVAAPDAPTGTASVQLLGAPGVGGDVVNPQTGGTFTTTALVVSGVGLVGALAALAFVTKRK